MAKQAYVLIDGAWVPTAGIPGPQGPPGTGGPGGADAYFVHTQATLSLTWTVSHNLGKHPAVHIEDAGGTQIYGTIMHVSDDTLTVTFQSSATGKAYCS